MESGEHHGLGLDTSETAWLAHQTERKRIKSNQIESSQFQSPEQPMGYRKVGAAGELPTAHLAAERPRTNVRPASAPINSRKIFADDEERTKRRREIAELWTVEGS